MAKPAPVADDAVLKTNTKKKYLLLGGGLLLLLGVVGAIVGGIIALRNSRRREVPPSFLGVSYTPWGSDVAGSSDSRRSIQLMKEANVNMVALNTFWFIDTPEATGPPTLGLEGAPGGYNYSTDDAGLVEGIRYIQSQGMEVFYKPNLNTRVAGDAGFRGNIPASAAFFASYEAWLVERAALAQRLGVSLLSVGTEFTAAQGDEAAWRRIVRSVRGVYDGRLTYAANHDAYQDVAWWDAVDLIGIDAYFPLTEDTDLKPSQSTIEARWVDRGKEIGAFRKAAGITSMPVIFAEAGFRSSLGATTGAGHAAGTDKGDSREDVSEELQADAYAALLNIMGSYRFEWWQGVFFWNWEVSPKEDERLWTSWTPQGKEALNVMSDAYQEWSD